MNIFKKTIPEILPHSYIFSRIPVPPVPLCPSPTISLISQSLSPSNIPHPHHNLHHFQPRHYRTMPDVRELSDMAIKLAGSGQYEKALDLVNKAIKLDANNANVWYNQGILLSKMGRYLDARNSFAQVADIDPGFAEAWYNKGIALMNLGKYLEAIRVFDKAIALNPHDHEARRQRDLAQQNIMESCGPSPSPSSSGKQTKLFK